MTTRVTLYMFVPDHFCHPVSEGLPDWPERTSGSGGRRGPRRRRPSPPWRRLGPWAAGRGPEGCPGCPRPRSRQSENVWKGYMLLLPKKIISTEVKMTFADTLSMVRVGQAYSGTVLKFWDMYYVCLTYSVGSFHNEYFSPCRLTRFKQFKQVAILN